MRYMKSGVKTFCRRMFEHAWLWLPVLLALLAMLPRILSAQFGLMDDGVTALNAQKMGEGILGFTDGGNSGRFRPVYWIYFSGLYRLIGIHPLAFYLLHALLLAVVIAMLALLVRRLGGNRVQAFLAAVLALTAGPMVENFYTLSKSEPLHALLTLVGLLVMLNLPQQTTKWGRVLIFGGAVLIFTAAAFAKETYVIMPFIALAWLALGWLLRRWPQGNVNLRLRSAVFVALVVAEAFFLVVALPSMTVQQSDNYASRMVLSLNSLVQSVIDWRAWLTRDFLFLLPISMLWGLLLALRKSSPAPMAALDALVFTLAWVVVFIPWEFKTEYYLLMAALGGAVFAGLVLGGLAGQWAGLKPGWKVLVGLLAAASGYLWLTTLPNQYNNARLQLTVDRANQEMVAYLAEVVPANGNVLVNLAPGSEYPNELDLHLKYFYNRDDIQIDLFQYQTSQDDSDPMEYWLISPSVVNKPVYSVRFGFLETAQERANRLLVDFMPKADIVFTGGYTQWVVRPLQPACWVLRTSGPCQQGSRWVSRLPLEYRWSVYHRSSDGLEPDRPGVVTPEGVWRLTLPDGSIREVQFGSGAGLPLAGDVDGDSQTDLALYDSSDGSLQVDTNLDGAPEMSLPLPEPVPGGWPFLGDWDGDGRDSPAIFDPDAAAWYFYDEGGQLSQMLLAGAPDDIPLAGDWDGDGRDTIGVYRPVSGEVDLENELTGPLSGVDFYAPPDRLPVAGRWAGLELDTLAFFTGGSWQPYYWNRDGEPVMQPDGFTLGATGDRPLAGRW